MTQFKVIEKDGQLELCIIGHLDEDTDFTELKLPDAKVYVFNLEDLSAVNSMGLRNWLMWVKKLKVVAPKIFKNCQRIVVDQMNILQGFLPRGAIVESFYVPYFCSSCSHEENYKVLRGQDFQEATSDSKSTIDIPKSIECPTCQKQMEIDVITQKYFAFLK